MSAFIVGAGNFGGKTNGSNDVVNCIPTPNRPFDNSMKFVTSIDQAALYRFAFSIFILFSSFLIHNYIQIYCDLNSLSGDANPLHIDPEFSKVAGHKTPILHGLCTLGFSVRAILLSYADNDSSLFKAVKARFTKPTIPGQTLEIQMWQNENRIHFKTVIVDSGIEVITGT